eukprot:scaffold1523_cov140-Isochrysis_galbana.AAC.1
MTRAGQSLPSASSVDVATGPHPPPPVASTKPPTNPSGARCAPNRPDLPAGCLGWSAWLGGSAAGSGLWTPASSQSGGDEKRKRRRTPAPTKKRREPDTRLAAPMGTDDSRSAPTSAPAAPAGDSRAMARMSTLPCRWCARPDTKVVPSWARWTDDEAVAGDRPAAVSTVAEVRPYPIPSEPSTSCAAKPAVHTGASAHASTQPRDATAGNSRLHWLRAKAQAARVAPGRSGSTVAEATAASTQSRRRRAARLAPDARRTAGPLSSDTATGESAAAAATALNEASDMGGSRMTSAIRANTTLVTRTAAGVNPTARESGLVQALGCLGTSSSRRAPARGRTKSPGKSSACAQIVSGDGRTLVLNGTSSAPIVVVRGVRRISRCCVVETSRPSNEMKCKQSTGAHGGLTPQQYCDLAVGFPLPRPCLRHTSSRTSPLPALLLPCGIAGARRLQAAGSLSGSQGTGWSRAVTGLPGLNASTEPCQFD